MQFFGSRIFFLSMRTAKRHLKKEKLLTDENLKDNSIASVHNYNHTDDEQLLLLIN